ncbi:MAG TPA: VCBS repeat-containing protein [Planctomycetes bacterium]|nr:VCBS repeat-containing protein [Planctomycetota bacterium]HIL35879.1 VCBS repeat-containing protein [Planctomycetota bacterium]
MKIGARLGTWARIATLGTIGAAFSSCESEIPQQEASKTMDATAAGRTPRPQAPWPTGLSARFELPMPGRTEGVIVMDADGDGIAEIIATCRSGSGGDAALRSFGPDLKTQLTVRLPDWPLGPVALERSSLIAVASRSSREVLILDLKMPRGQEIIQRRELDSAPRALAAGPALFETAQNTGQTQATLAVATRAGELLLFPITTDQNAPLGTSLSVPLLEPHTTFLALDASMVVVGSMGAGSDGEDCLRRYMVSGPNSLTPGPPEPLTGIPRDWLLTPAAELLAGGDHDLWNHDGSTWRNLLQAGRAPLSLLGLGGERFACVSSDLSVRVFGMQGLEQSFYGGQDTWDLAGGDLDGDSLTDLVLANRGAERVSVLFSNASGSWRRPRSLPTGIAPLVLVAADFSNSGHPDLLTVDAGTDGLSFFRLHNGSYQPTAQPSPGPGVSEAIACDFDADGNLDLAVRARDEVRILAGDGQGNLTDPKTMAIAGMGPLLARASDLLVAGTAGLYLVVPDQDPKATVLESPCTAIAALADGRVLIGQGGERSGILLLTSNLQADGFLPLPGKPLDLVTVKLDENGPTQILALLQGVRDNSPGKLARLAPNDNGTYKLVQELPVGLRPHALAAGDMNGDGRLEVVVSAQNSHHVNLFGWSAEETLTRLPDLGAGRGPLDVTFIPSPGESGSESATLIIGCNFSNEILLIKN